MLKAYAENTLLERIEKGSFILSALWLKGTQHLFERCDDGEACSQDAPSKMRSPIEGLEIHF